MRIHKKTERDRDDAFELLVVARGVVDRGRRPEKEDIRAEEKNGELERKEIEGSGVFVAKQRVR